MTKKHKNLQPWLDYFGLLQQYEQTGYLEVKADKHEAYVTRAALLTLVPEVVQGSRFKVQSEPTVGKNLEPETLNLEPGDDSLLAVVSALRTYAAYLAAHQRGVQDFVPQTLADPNATLPPIPEKELTAYLSQNFAVHIVKEDYPHDLLLTLLLQQKRSWRTAWRTVDFMETIDYTEQKPQEK